MAYRTRLPGAQAGTRARALRGPRLARFPPSRHALHRSLWLPGRRTGEDSPSGWATPKLTAIGLPRGDRPHHPSNFLARWRCRVIEGRVVDWERLGGGDGRDRDDGGRDWSRLGRALAAAEQEAARRFGSPCGDRLGRA